jgi:ribonuclease HI
LESVLKRISNTSTMNKTSHITQTLKDKTEWLESRGKPQFYWIPEGTGAGVYCQGTRRKLSFSLWRYTTVFQAEVYAIKECAIENLDRNIGIGPSTFYQSVKLQIKHLVNTRSPKLVCDCHQSHIQLAEHNRVQLIWVPGHEVFVGNETADQLARTGSEHPLIGPEPSCCISVEVAKKAVRDWTNRNHIKQWE